jgi:hypothetical protein
MFEPEGQWPRQCDVTGVRAGEYAESATHQRGRAPPATQTWPSFLDNRVYTTVWIRGPVLPPFSDQ